MIEFNKVTWYSKVAAIILFILIIPVLTFYIGMQYEQTQNILKQAQPTEQTHNTMSVNPADVTAPPELLGDDEIATSTINSVLTALGKKPTASKVDLINTFYDLDVCPPQNGEACQQIPAENAALSLVGQPVPTGWIIGFPDDEGYNQSFQVYFVAKNGKVTALTDSSYNTQKKKVDAPAHGAIIPYANFTFDSKYHGFYSQELGNSQGYCIYTRYYIFKNNQLVLGKQTRTSDCDVPMEQLTNDFVVKDIVEYQAPDWKGQ